MKRRQMENKDYYNILGVEKSCSQDDIKKAYRKLAKKYHPDLNNGRKTYEEKLKDINEAYEVLGDSIKRKAYDEKANRQQYKANYSYSSYKDSYNFEEDLRARERKYESPKESYYSSQHYSSQTKDSSSKRKRANTGRNRYTADFGNRRNRSRSYSDYNDDLLKMFFSDINISFDMRLRIETLFKQKRGRENEMLRILNNIILQGKTADFLSSLAKSFMSDIKNIF